MTIIEIFQPGDSQEDEPIIKETIQVESIQPSRVTPLNDKVGIQIKMKKLSNLIFEIKPIDPPDEEELESYYAQEIPVYDDGNFSPRKLDLPHHIGLRVVLESVLQKYERFDDLQIRIS